MSTPLIHEAAAQAMDDAAAWAVSHMPVVQPANRADDATTQQCYDVLQQSLAHYRNAGRMTTAQATKQRHILRAQFLKAEAAEMFDEQWEAYAVECFDEDGYRPSRNSQADVSGAMACWEKWDAEGHKLYQQLLHRAYCAEIDARNVA